VRVAGAIEMEAFAVASQASDLAATPSLPFRAQAGVAWEAGRWTLAADVILLGPRHVVDNPERASEGLDREVIRNVVGNVAVGGEVALGGGFALRAGFFTDFASSDKTSLNVQNTSHVNHYGLTLGAGLRTEHVKTDVGFTGWYGKGSDVIPVDLDFSRLGRTDATEYGLFVYLATAYEF
jgi:hypothetical protein